MPPIISVVGHSNSGKTTLLEKIVPELRSRGYRVATIKHAQEIHIDQPGTDSWRLIEAGSLVTVLATQDRVVLIKPISSPLKLDEVVHLLDEDYDIIIVEGFKGESAPKIEVQRNETGPLLTELKGLFAVVSDEPVETKARKFSWSDIQPLVDLIEEGFIKPQHEHISVYANGKPVVLSSFPGEFIKNIMLAMAASLKGVEEPKSLEFRWGKRD